MILFTIMLASLFGFCFTILVLLGLFLGVMVSMQYKSSEPASKPNQKRNEDLYNKDEEDNYKEYSFDEFPDNDW